jgi:hypothetical protein
MEYEGRQYIGTLLIGDPVFFQKLPEGKEWL